MKLSEEFLFEKTKIVSLGRSLNKFWKIRFWWTKHINTAPVFFFTLNTTKLMFCLFILFCILKIVVNFKNRNHFVLSSNLLLFEYTCIYDFVDIEISNSVLIWNVLKSSVILDLRKQMILAKGGRPTFHTETLV